MHRPGKKRFGNSLALVQSRAMPTTTGEQRGNKEQDFPLSRLLLPAQLGGDNLPRFTATTDEDIFEYRLVKNESLFLQLQAPVVLEALTRIIASRPIPSLEELTRHFAGNPVVPPDLAAAIGRSFLRFWAGDAEGSAFTVTPQIEALARNLLIQADVGIYQSQREKSPGQYPGLRFLLGELSKRGLDTSWHRFILVLCVHVAGFNFRNELSHGFVLGVDDGLAALLLQAAAYLASLNTTPRTAPENTERETDKAEPDQSESEDDS